MPGLSAPYPSTLGPLQISKTLVVQGAVAVASGGTDYLPPWIVAVPSGYAGSVAKVRYKLRTGSATIKLTLNGTDITGLTSLAVSTSTATTSSSQSVSDGDLIAVVVTAVASSPDNLTVDCVLGLAA